MKEHGPRWRTILNGKFVVLFFFLLMLLIRLVYLDADPSFVKRVSDVGDEGVWVHNARTLFVFGDLAPDGATQGISVTPLNTLLMMESFSLFGVGAFQARLVSALAGWFTLLILYFFIKKAWGDKAAVVSALILGINETFLIYNKIALGVSLEGMFILLSFYLWYLGKDKKVHYFLSGIFFSFAILSKLSAYYLAPVFVVLWLLQLYRKETSFKAIFGFGFGAVLPLIPFLIYLKSNWGILADNFLMLKSFYNSQGVIAFNFFRVFTNNFFGLPGMFFLLLFTFFYFLNKSVCQKNGIKEGKCFDGVELMMVCWAVLGFLLLILFSDLSDRRFFGLMIPLAVLSTKFFLERKTIDLRSILNKISAEMKERNPWKKIKYSLLFAFPVASFIISAFSLYFCSPIRLCNDKQWLMIFLFLTIFILFLIAIILTAGVRRDYVIHVLTISGIAILLLMPLSTLIRHFSRHFAIVTSTVGQETSYIFSSVTIIAIIIVSYILLSFHFKDLLLIDWTVMKSIFLLYFVVSGALMAITFITPSFSVRDNSQLLNEEIGKAKVSGPITGALSLEASFLPIWVWACGRRPLKGVNCDYDRNSIRYIFKIEVFDGKPVTEKFDDFLSEYTKSHLVKRIYLYPYPFTKKYKEVLALYEVEGYKGGSAPPETTRPLLTIYDYTG